MDERLMQYQLIYALAARNGRSETLFGSSGAAAFEAFARSLASSAFPELWFELPLLGEPWFDLHALTARSDLRPNMKFSPQQTGDCPEAFEWFAAQERGVRQLALSWDTSSGNSSTPAVQLLASESDPSITQAFLRTVGKPDAAASYLEFRKRLPQSWFPCYAGVFPQRPEHHLRVECIPNRERQRAYADDSSLLEADLRQAGLLELGDTVVERCQALASTPFQFEFQFDVQPDGSTSPTLGASVRFAPPAKGETRESFEVDGSAGALMQRVEEWGLVDERWRDLGETTFSVRASRRGANTHLYCFPTFLKLRWRDGEPLDAKAYLMAGQREEAAQEE